MDVPVHLNWSKLIKIKSKKTWNVSIYIIQIIAKCSLLKSKEWLLKYEQTRASTTQAVDGYSLNFKMNRMTAIVTFLFFFSFFKFKLIKMSVKILIHRGHGSFGVPFLRHLDFLFIEDISSVIQGAFTVQNYQNWRSSYLKKPLGWEAPQETRSPVAFRRNTKS